MPDPCHDRPSPLVPGVIGGMVGAALIDATHRETTAQLHREIEALAATERARLDEEQKRLALARMESQRNEYERAFRQAVLWFEHCANDARLDWLARQHGPALADAVVILLLDEARRHPDLATLFDAAHAARSHCNRLQEALHTGETQRAALRDRRWTRRRIWGCGALVGLGTFWLLRTFSETPGLTACAWFLAALALLGPLIVRIQPTPGNVILPIDRPYPGPMRKTLARVESVVAAAKAKFSTATIEHALARVALAQAFAARRRALLDGAIRHVGLVRPRLDELQTVYPPAVRCELAAFSDAGLHARLAPHLPAALDRGVAKLI